jgi:FtsP/CotA-like multicopper oxidase with cupredoxin domain
MDTSNLTRRDALKIGAFGAAAVAVPLATHVQAREISTLAASKLVPYKTTFATPPVAKIVPMEQRPAKWRRDDVDFYRLEQRQFSAQILAGVNTALWGYSGCVPGPTIRVNRNRKVVVRQVNKLPGQHPQLGYKPWTSTHLHGSPSKPQFDGYADDSTNPGEWKDYEYENHMSARTLWYHDHGVHHTAENAYMGLAGQYQCIDSGASTSGIVLPKLYGWNDFPMVLADKAFASSGDLLFDDEGHSSMFGDVNTVNGRAWPVMKVEPRVYRFRILNAATSRGYRLKLNDGRPMALIGTDAGLTTKVRHLTAFRIGMAERYEVLIDFSQDAPGAIVDLLNLGLPNTRDYANTNKVMRFQVVAAGEGTASTTAPPADSPQWTVKMPANGVALSPGAPAMDRDLPLTSPIAAVRNLELTRNNGQWTVGPHTWEEVVASGYDKVFGNPMPGTVEKWIVQNSSGGWFHPVHIHLVDFRVLRRNGAAPHAWEAVGGKDVVYVGENETVELLMRFEPQARGRYMIHCHNLTHEDHDMMTQFRVGTEVKDSVAMYTDDEVYHDTLGNEILCDKDDPVLARHPCSAPEV